MATKIPGLPPVPASITDPALRQWMQSFAETVAIRAGQQGDPLDRAVTLRELYAAGVVNIPQNSSSVAGLTVDFESMPANDALLHELTPPSAPDNFQVSVTPVSAILTFNAPFEPHVAHAEIYRSLSDDIDQAAVLGVTPGQSFADTSVIPEHTYFYWVRFVSYAGIPSAYSSLSGLSATILPNTLNILDQLNGALSETELNIGFSALEHRHYGRLRSLFLKLIKNRQCNF